ARRGRATRRRLHPRRAADVRGCRRPRPAVAEGHLQRCDQPDRRADGADARPGLRAPGLADDGLGARRRGGGGRRGAGDRARLGPGGADRPRRQARGRLRPQGVDAPGRRGPAHHRDRLPERRYRPLRARARGADPAQRGDLGARERSGAVVAAVTGPTYPGLPREEIERRYERIRTAAARDGLDAVVICGNEYTGFEGAVTYLSGFVIVHRYAYVLLPVEGDPAIVFPSEARYVGEHGTTWIAEQMFVDRPGDWLAEQLRGRRVGVYGLDYVMTVRDHEALAAACELVGWDVAFDHARAVKSELELESVRESVRINTEGFWVFLEAFEPGKTEREILAPCEEYFVSQGCGRWTMDMVLDGPNGAALPEFRIAGTRPVEATDLLLPSLEIAGPGGHWVEVSRAICAGEPSDQTKRMLEAYVEYYDLARDALRAGSTARDAHRAVA